MTQPIFPATWRSMKSPVSNARSVCRWADSSTPPSEANGPVLCRVEQRFHRLLETTGNYIYTVHVKDGRSVRVSHGPGCITVTGYTPENYAASPDLWYQMVHESDRPAVLAQVERVLSGDAVQPLEHRIRHKNGSVRWVRNTPVAHKDEAGRVVAYDGLILDITERRLAEQRLSVEYLVSRALAASDALTEVASRVLAAVCEGLDHPFGAVWKVMPGTDKLVCVATWRKPGLQFPKFEAATRQMQFARGTGLPGRVWASGEPDWATTLSQDRGHLQAAAATQEGLGACLGFPIRTGPVTQGVLEMYDRQIQRPDGQLLQLMATVGAEIGQFIEHLQAEEALRASHEELRTTQLQLIQAAKTESIGTLAAGVAHEVKNPLQVILMGLAYLTRNGEGTNPDTRLVLTDMHDAAKRADAIVRDLLQFSAASDLDLRGEDLNAVVERSLQFVNFELLRLGVSVDRQLADSLPLVRLDKGKIQQVLINLLMNALQAMPQGGTITVRTYRGRNGRGDTESHGSDGPCQEPTAAVVAEVDDTGAGISEANLTRIFDPFFTTKPVGLGTGLGLPISKKIMELHGGTIAVANRQPQGLRATLTFRP